MNVENEEGQSTIEFCLTLVMLFAFVLFYIQLSLVLAFGNYAHYATFMAARAYLSAGVESSEEQRTRARDVIIQMLKRSSSASGVDKFPFIAKGVGGGDPGGMQIDHEKFVPNDPDFSWLQGIRYKFRSKVMMIPLAGRGKGAGAANSLTLESESFLGRDPSAVDCKTDMGTKKGIIDNGC